MKHLDRKNNDDKLILDKHLTRYLDAIGKTMLITEAVVLVCTSIIAFLVIKGIYPYELHTQYNISLNFYFAEQFTHKLIAWIIIGIYILINKKLSLRQRKILLCSTVIILTALIVFGSWNVNYFGFLFIIPIVIASPFSKKTNIVVFSFCIFFEFIYTLMQVWLRGDNYNYVMGIVVTTVLVAFFFISKSIHKTMFNALIDVKKFSVLSKSLYNEVTHDNLTNSFSFTALQKVISEENKYSSLAFIDIDNFKSINDKHGHAAGDNILKLLVTIVKNFEDHIFRYGGDEFVILSNTPIDDFTVIIQEIAKDFKNASDDFYNIKGTLSVGVMNITGKENLGMCIEECDKLMYQSKNSGKNRITVEGREKSIHNK